MEVRNIKRRLAMVLCVCILCASAMPAALAEDVVQVQAATPSEAKPELAQMTISGASGSAGTLTLSVKGTAGKKVKVTLYTMDETELDNRTITLEGGAEASSLPVFLPAHMPQTFSIMTRQAETTPERVRRLSRT